MTASTAETTRMPPSDPACESAYPDIALRESIGWDALAIRPGALGIARHCGKLLHGMAVEWQLRQRLKRTGYVLILSHMRSGSSMLTQLLCSHPEMAGYGETHTAYRGARDLLRAGQAVYRMLRKWRVKHKYLVDKILHTELLPDVEPLKLLPVKWIVLARNPADAIASMVRTLDMSRHTALAYYQARLRAMEQQADALVSASVPVFFTTYERCTSAPDKELSRLSDFLELANELQPQYEVQRGAQRPGAGDPSDVLRAGRILPRNTAEHDGCQRLLREYESWVERLDRTCAGSLAPGYR